MSKTGFGQMYRQLSSKLLDLVVVEHDMSFIDTISEKVTVLAQGAILAEGTLAEVQANEDVIEKYLGR